MDQSVNEAVRQVFLYHDATKHHPRRYARSLGYLDWATQPDPFRRYIGAPTLQLLIGARANEPSYDAIYEVGAVPAEPVNRKSISVFLECALGLSAWKSFKGTTWALRCNPSSGNLHPTEGYVILGPIDGLTESAGVFHYVSRDHLLEERRRIEINNWKKCAAYGAGDARDRIFFVSLTSILWREAWKYGERAFRYCQHDAGHALAALRISAAMLGWRLHVLNGPGDDDVARILGVDRAEDYDNVEREHPDMLAIVSAIDRPPVDQDGLIDALLATVADAAWRGKANSLSRDHVPWDIIDMVADATHKHRIASSPRLPSEAFPLPLPRGGWGECLESEMASKLGAPLPSSGDNPHPSPLPKREREQTPTARDIILRRRSAVSFDAETSIPKETFYAMLSRTLPGRPPWDAVDWPVSVHLAMFVHRVDGLPPGLYVLARDALAVSFLKESMQKDFDWATPPDCPADLPLFFLYEADCRQAAAQLSLGQDIAGDSAFSLGMLATVESTLAREGPSSYRRLYWEAGMVGQVLYLEAESAAVRLDKSIRATGIGAYFDDLVHEVFGLSGHGLQSLYHFTVGGAVDDERLTTLPPYDADVVERR